MPTEPVTRRMIVNEDDDLCQETFESREEAENWMHPKNRIVLVEIREIPPATPSE